MALEIRTITDDEIAAYREAMLVTFGEDAESDPDGPERVRALVPRNEQLWAAFDRGAVVATSGTYDFTVTVPGGQLEMAGLTMVSVRPTHRRRGILRELMRLHLDEARSRGIPLSGLWASEASIYGRFGYGIAVEGDELEIEDGRAVELVGPREVDDLEWADEARARSELPELYARALAGRPGALTRSAAWWRERRFLESGWQRGAGTSRRRHVIAVRGGERVGYLAYRQKGGLSTTLPAGKVEIVELIGIDARAERTLWQFALNVDLFPGVRWWNAPVDDAFPWTVANQAQIQRKRSDTMWLRIDDVAAVLAARRYAVDGVLRFAIDDRAWDLIVEDGRGMCEARPDSSGVSLRLGRAALGSLYLGGVSAAVLARAGQLQGDAAAIALATRMFASERAPWCPEVF